MADELQATDGAPAPAKSRAGLVLWIVIALLALFVLLPILAIAAITFLGKA